jgi:hypothetical protein
VGVNIFDFMLTNGSSLEMGIINGNSITSSFEDESLRV